MRALELQEPGRFVWREVPEPKPEALGLEEVLVKVCDVGLCGTDINAYHGRQAFFSYPRILGHELGVRIVDVGKAVVHLKSGDLCAVEPYLSEPGDIAYERGKSNCSESTRCLGVHLDGGMQDYLVLPAKRLHCSERLSTDILAMVEPLCIGHHAVERARLIGDEHVAVVGLGPIGLGVVQFATLSGAKVFGVDICPRRLERAKDLYPSMELILLQSGVTLPDSWRALGHRFPEVVWDCTGNKASMEDSVRLVCHGGRLVLVGISNGELCFSNPDFHKRELSIISSRNATSSNFRSVIKLLEGGEVNVLKWITHRSSAEDFPNCIDKWLRTEERLLKGIITFC